MVAVHVSFFCAFVDVCVQYKTRKHCLNYCSAFGNVSPKNGEHKRLRNILHQKVVEISLLKEIIKKYMLTLTEQSKYKLINQYKAKKKQIWVSKLKIENVIYKKKIQINNTIHVQFKYSFCYYCV